jgi:predicted RecB family endonuclease
MKVWITELTHDNKSYEGPVIHAHTQEDAIKTAEELGVTFVGELSDIILITTEDCKNIH